jgi:hypothetical protein
MPPPDVGSGQEGLAIRTGKFGVLQTERCFGFPGDAFWMMMLGGKAGRRFRESGVRSMKLMLMGIRFA